MALCLLCLLAAPVGALVPLTGRHGQSRREAISACTAAAGTYCFLLTATSAGATGNVVVTPDAGAGAKMEAVKAAKTPEAAKTQLVAGYRALGKLLDEFDAVVTAEGGDGVRRVLGTVGTTSPCYLIEPAFRLLFEADESLPMEVFRVRT